MNAQLETPLDPVCARIAAALALECGSEWGRCSGRMDEHPCCLPRFHHHAHEYDGGGREDFAFAFGNDGEKLPPTLAAWEADGGDPAQGPCLSWRDGNSDTDGAVGWEVFEAYQAIGVTIVVGKLVARVNIGTGRVQLGVMAPDAAPADVQRLASLLAAVERARGGR